jgi:GntR family transcriptional regulator
VHLDFTSSRPIYSQIVHEFSKAVVRGDLAPGDKVPSQRELAEEQRVNPNTVQRAYREMEQMELVETLRGQGTFVKSNPTLLKRLRDELANQAVTGFLAEMQSLGYSKRDIATRVNSELGEEGATTLG